MATKTFKIGECCKGGIIKVITDNDSINIRVIDMFSKKEIAIQNTVIDKYDLINCTKIERRISDYLHDITTAYYTDNIMKWIKEKTGLNFMWC